MRCYLPQVVLSPLTVVLKERRLPAPGDILVREGDRVEPVQVIGRALRPGEFRIINVSQALGVPRRAVRRYLKVEVGQEVRRGDVLAARGGLVRRVCRAPIEGAVTGIGGGRLIIEAPAQPVEVRAGYPGIVKRVFRGEGVVIQVTGAVIQGTWGNLQEGFGVLRLVTESREKPLRERMIDASCRGAVLMAGILSDGEALDRAIEMQVRGIIVGSLMPEMVEKATVAPFPIVATEGIGNIPMSTQAFRLLSTHNGREAVVDGAFAIGRSPVRPEILIPLPADKGTGLLQAPETPLKTGDIVRVVRSPYAGRIGTVVEILPAGRAAASSRLPAAKVQVAGEEELLLIPVYNLEVVRS
ncbi:MAG: hypothetical protein RML46_02230 [Anaerolineae bacterium]|nr:hypothetical protein [Anaerolineae bacterium]MDW8067714.1 hypothetical protein [Anaerolineae bacterium]